MKNRVVRGGALAAYFFLLSLAVLLFASSDSYLYDISGRCDSSWFFMCGKAWMNGLTPYVDFSDSKGPLLWLIYGIGYLLSPRDFIGVFWISVLFYATTFYFVYRTVLLFTGNRLYSLLAPLVMAFAFFFPGIHNEVRAEDFALTFLMASLYATCRLLYGTDERPPYARCGFLMGLCFGANLLMKYNIAAMSGIFVVYTWAKAWTDDRRRLWKLFLWQVVGCLAIVLPFALYFLCKGIFGAFVQGYVVDAFVTVQRTPIMYSPKYLAAWAVVLAALVSLCTKRWKLFPLLALGFYVLGIYPYSREYNYTLFAVVCALSTVFWMKRWQYFPLVSCLAFVIVVHNSLLYYFLVLSLFILMGIVSAYWALPRRFLATRLQFAVYAVCLYSLFLVFNQSTVGSWEWSDVRYTDDVPRRRHFYEACYVMSQVENPKILNWNQYERGFSVPVDGLPACRYWARQNGATPAMEADQEDCVMRRVADFVFTRKNDTVRVEKLDSLGYFPYDFFEEGDGLGYDNEILYSKHRLRMPSKSFHVTNADVLLKRRIFP